MESMFHQMEDSYKRDMAELNSTLQSFHDRVEAAEHIIPSMTTGYSEVQLALTDHHIQLQTLWMTWRIIIEETFALEVSQRQ